MSCEHWLWLIDVVQAAEGHEGSKAAFLIKMGLGVIHTDWETLYYLLTDTTILNDIYQSEEKNSIYGQIRGRKYIGNFISDFIGQTSSLHRKIQTFWSKGSKGKKFEFAWVNHEFDKRGQN